MKVLGIRFCAVTEEAGMPVGLSVSFQEVLETPSQ